MDIEVLERFIRAAIKERRLLQFRYERAIRVVEPHQVGYSAGGELMMLAWPAHADCGEGWQEFRVGSISGIAIIGGDFHAPHLPRPTNTSMTRILCQVPEAVVEVG